MLPMLLYACETWTVYQGHAKKLNHFHTTCLRKLRNIKWQDRIPDTEVLAQADLPSIYTILMQSQLCWAGHVARMPDHWLPKRLFYGKLQQGKRSHGGQKKHFKDTLKPSLKAFAITPDSWEQTAMDRAKWRSSVFKGSKICEANRTVAAEQRRQARKARASNPQDDSPSSRPNCQLPSVHGLALSTICALTRSSPNYPQMIRVVLVDSTDEHDSIIILFCPITGCTHSSKIIRNFHGLPLKKRSIKKHCQCTK